MTIYTEKDPPQHIGKETFIVTDGLSETRPTNECYFYRNIADVQEHILECDLADADTLTVLHGFMTSAKSIPDTKYFDTGVFIIIEDSGVYGSFLIEEYDVTETKELMEYIEEILESGSYRSQPPDIDNVFIFYGYCLELSLTVNPDNIDEDKTLPAQKMSEAASILEESGE